MSSKLGIEILFNCNNLTVDAESMQLLWKCLDYSLDVLPGNELCINALGLPEYFIVCNKTL